MFAVKLRPAFTFEYTSNAISVVLLSHPVLFPAPEKNQTKGAKRGFAFQRGVAGTSCSTLNGIVARLSDAGLGEEIAFIQTPDLCVCVRAAAAAGGGGYDVLPKCLIGKQTDGRETKVCLRLRRSPFFIPKKWKQMGGGGEQGSNGPVGPFVQIKQFFFFVFFFKVSKLCLPYEETTGTLGQREACNNKALVFFFACVLS